MRAKNLPAQCITQDRPCTSTSRIGKSQTQRSPTPPRIPTISTRDMWLQATRTQRESRHSGPRAESQQANKAPRTGDTSGRAMDAMDCTEGVRASAKLARSMRTEDAGPVPSLIAKGLSLFTFPLTSPEAHRQTSNIFPRSRSARSSILNLGRTLSFPATMHAVSLCRLSAPPEAICLDSRRNSRVLCAGAWAENSTVQWRHV